MRKRFEAARGSQLEVLDAQVAATRAHFNAVPALAEYHTGLAICFDAAGRVR